MSNVLGCFLLTGFQLALLSTAYGDRKLVGGEVECVDQILLIKSSFLFPLIALAVIFKLLY